MHAEIHNDFKAFVEGAHSPETYQQILAEAGLDAASFEDQAYHNDGDMDRALNAAGTILSQSRLDFLTEMGIAGSPGLLEAFEGYREDGWNVLDLLEHIEPRMHKHVREEMGAFPPALKTERLSDTEVRIDILSHRNFAGLANGFITGFAAHYGDTVDIRLDESDTGYTFHVVKTN
ncbi:MAG: heme NO-binding domain-containing protein [Acidimicrobiia bacterium]|nr:heme NO-binding domain-containing protein [Acidimicrobiia bacterium]